MKYIFITALVVLLTSKLIGQLTDSATVVKQIAYEHGQKGQDYNLITKQQAMAKPKFYKGYAFADNHEFNKAIKYLIEAIMIDSTGNCGTGINGMAQSELGYVYLRLNDFSNALKYINNALSINKMLAEPYLSKAVILVKHKNEKEALATLNLLIETIPDHAVGYAQRGFLYKSMGNSELALQDFNRFIRIVKDQNQLATTSAMVDDIMIQIEELESMKKE